MNQQTERGSCDDWTKIPVHCAECGAQFLRKVRYQQFCDEHRYLAGAVIKPLDHRTSNLVFIECDTCRAKLGSPPLCAGCLHNRLLIEQLRSALWGTVHLLEGWAYGPLFEKAGVIWPAGKCQAPALLAAKKLIMQPDETKP